MAIALQTVNLTKKYDNQVALNALNLSVEKGEIFCLLGQNGAGKTTTLHLVLGFTAPDSGSIFINGSEANTTTRKQLAYIPEVVQLYPHLDALENLAFFSRLAGYKYSKEALAGFLDKAGLEKAAHNQRLSGYSKGMRQKVGIAIALAKNADLILMDEPTSGLDPRSTAEFAEICKELASQGKTLVMATHDIFSAVNTGSRIGIMKRGSMVHTVAAGSITADELQKLYLEILE
ncbi:ABC transporter ATP-binding protein [Leadbetterella sp. DM7]|uniref:ABC transporter ATP-binding protein n=1 Tax=Leadbetterella sp. DM7 TaxID=3235085 RepID=UPI00349EAE72